MNLTELIRNLKRYDQNAAVIFDDEEPIGRPTDLVLPPGRRWFRRRERVKAVTLSKPESKIS
jgi:hypothetical protein